MKLFLKEISQESIFVPVNSSDTLHLKRIFQDSQGPVVFMLHGSIENGRVFYSQNGKGLAPYLARNGFDVYVADQRGRGASTPSINRHSRYGQTEAITEDIPALIRTICERRGKCHQHWIGHSWGGVLLSSYLARFKDHRPLVDSMVFFGTKRTIRTQHIEKWIKIDLIWKMVSRWLIEVCGYLPAQQLRFGSDNETDKSHLHTKLWIGPNSPWVDPDDHFNYGETIKNIDFPATLSLTGAGDTYLGNPKDVADFVSEINPHRRECRILGLNQGNRHNYGHVDILTDSDAVEDHFPLVLKWLKEHNHRGFPS